MPHIRNHLWPKDLVNVPLGIEVPIQYNEARSTSLMNSTPNHQTPATPAVLLDDTSISISLTLPAPYADPSITVRETKSGLIGEKDSSPLTSSPL